MNKQYEVVCAWCNELTAYSEKPNSHGICPKCLNNLLKLPELSYEELNALPFGIILLSQDGTITFYNSAEENLSHKTADEVIGQNFFTEIAPCTQVKGFQGNFQNFISGNDVSKSFSFTFYFSHGKVAVDIVFVKAHENNVIVTTKKHELVINDWQSPKQS